MVLREKYIKKIRPFYESDLIKIITGIRRCGKSIVLQQVRDEIARQTDNIIFLEFENRRIKNQIPDVDFLYHSNQSSSIWGIIHKNVTRFNEQIKFGDYTHILYHSFPKTAQE